MFKCNSCGKIFDEPYNYSVEESRGEYWGIPCTETMYYSECPHCGEDDFVEGKMFYVEGKVYALVDDEMCQVADFDGEYFAEDDGEALYDEVLADQMTKWCSKFGDDLDVDIEAYWEA